MVRRRTRRAAAAGGGGDSACRQKCVAELRACTSQATTEFLALMERCRHISDPRQRAECEANAATFYAAWLQACQTAFDLCLEGCR